LGWSRTSNWYDDKPTAQEKFSILLLGDSVTQGDGLEPQEVYPHLLYQQIRREQRQGVKRRMLRLWDRLDAVQRIARIP
jgi:hypothetical protein